MTLENANPVVYESSKAREITDSDEDDDVIDKFDDREIFGKHGKGRVPSISVTVDFRNRHVLRLRRSIKWLRRSTSRSP